MPNFKGVSFLSTDLVILYSSNLVRWIIPTRADPPGLILFGKILKFFEEFLKNPNNSKNFGKYFFKFHFLNLFYRFGYFVFEQPGALDYADEGGPTDACSPNMSNGRGPFK